MRCTLRRWGPPPRSPLMMGPGAAPRPSSQRPAHPPRQGASAAAGAARKGQGEALATTSTWAGPRQQQPPAPAQPPMTSLLGPHAPLKVTEAPASRSASQSPAPQSGRGGGGALHLLQQPRPLGGSVWPQSQQDPQRGELDGLRGLIEELRAELRALRRENELLRRAQVTQLTPVAAALPPLPMPSFSPVRPAPTTGTREGNAAGPICLGVAFARAGRDP